LIRVTIPLLSIAYVALRTQAANPVAERLALTYREGALDRTDPPTPDVVPLAGRQEAVPLHVGKANAEEGALGWIGCSEEKTGLQLAERLGQPVIARLECGTPPGDQEMKAEAPIPSDDRFQPVSGRRRQGLSEQVQIIGDDEQGRLCCRSPLGPPLSTFLK
jgi:hypothetical protein